MTILPQVMLSPLPSHSPSPAFPYEILSHIFSHLDNPTLASCCLVSYPCLQLASHYLYVDVRLAHPAQAVRLLAAKDHFNPASLFILPESCVSSDHPCASLFEPEVLTSSSTPTLAYKVSDELSFRRAQHLTIHHTPPTSGEEEAVPMHLLSHLIATASKPRILLRTATFHLLPVLPTYHHGQPDTSVYSHAALQALCTHIDPAELALVGSLSSLVDVTAAADHTPHLLRLVQSARFTRLRTLILRGIVFYPARIPWFKIPSGEWTLVLDLRGSGPGEGAWESAMEQAARWIAGVGLSGRRFIKETGWIEVEGGLDRVEVWVGSVRAKETFRTGVEKRLDARRVDWKESGRKRVRVSVKEMEGGR